MDLRARLKAFLKSMGLSEGKFEAQLGVGKGFTSNVGKSIRTDIYLKIQELFPDLNTTWLLTGEGSMYNTNTDPKPTILKEPIPTYGKPTPTTNQIAILNVYADANPNAIVRFWDERVDIQDYMQIPDFKDCPIAIYVRGDSMTKDFYPGDLVPLKPIYDLDVIPFGEPFIIVTGEHILFKYIRRGPERNLWTLRSANVAYDDIDLDKGKVIKLFQVKGKIQRRS